MPGQAVPNPGAIPAAEQVQGELALLRMRMMPYWYSAFARYHFEGLPPFRAMNLEEGFAQDVKSAVNSNLEERIPMRKQPPKEIQDQLWPVIIC